MLFLTYLLVFVALAVLLWAGTTWFQGYIYSEPAEQLWWRAPAAAGVLTVFLAFWGFLAYRAPGDYPAQFQFSSEGKEIEFSRMKALYPERPPVELRRIPGRRAYADAQGQPMKTRPLAVIVVEEDGTEVRFEAERDEKGYFKTQDNKPLRYLDDRGRVMTEGDLGFLPTSRPGLFWGNMLLNLVHLAVWFGVSWLLLNYQWPHALGFAVVLWLIMTMSVAQMLVERVERARKERPLENVPASLREAATACARCTANPPEGMLPSYLLRQVYSMVRSSAAPGTKSANASTVRMTV